MHIAVCDDEKNCLDNMEQLLKSYPGISRTEYYQKLEDLSAALKSGITYDLILMDIEWNQSTENGIQFAAQYNLLSPQTQFIFVTAYNDKFSQKIFWETINLCGYLVKPVQKENLESKAHQIVIHTLSGEVTIYEKLDVYEKRLHKDFVRIHKSFLVNMRYIRRIEMKEVTMQDGTVLPVSKARYSASRDKYFRFMRAML